MLLNTENLDTLNLAYKGIFRNTSLTRKQWPLTLACCEERHSKQ